MHISWTPLPLTLHIPPSCVLNQCTFNSPNFTFIVLVHFNPHLPLLAKTFIQHSIITNSKNLSQIIFALHVGRKIYYFDTYFIIILQLVKLGWVLLCIVSVPLQYYFYVFFLVLLWISIKIHKFNKTNWWIQF